MEIRVLKMGGVECILNHAAGKHPQNEGLKHRENA